ncbi:MAG: hypothetical protein ACRC6U_04090, partial [Fusobacteriaceae bacterium]
TKAGGNATKTVKSSFERAKLALIAEYLEEINYFSEKKMVIESQLVAKSNEPKTMSHPEPIVEFGEKRRDVGSLLGGLSGNLTVKGTKDNLAPNRDLVRTENLVVEKTEEKKKTETISRIIEINENNDKLVERQLDRKEIGIFIQKYTNNISLIYGLDEDTELNLKVEVAEVVLESEIVTENLVKNIFKKIMKKYI